MGDGRDDRSLDLKQVDPFEILDLAVKRNAFFDLHLSHEEHVRTILVLAHAEVLINVLSQHAGGKGTKGFAELYLQVHQRLHLRRASIPDDRAGPERSRAELHAPAHKADHLFFCDQIGEYFQQFSFVVVIMVPGADSIKECLDLVIVELWTQKGGFLKVVDAVHLAGTVQELIPNEKRPPQSANRVARRRLDPEDLEDPLSQYL